MKMVDIEIAQSTFLSPDLVKIILTYVINSKLQLHKNLLSGYNFIYLFEISIYDKWKSWIKYTLPNYNYACHILLNLFVIIEMIYSIIGNMNIFIT